MKRSALLICLLLCLSACGGGAPADSQPTAIPAVPTPNPADLPSSAAGVPVVARVNGIDILKTDYDRSLSRNQQLSIAADANALARTVLDTLIEQQVIEQAAAELNVVVTDAEIDADINNMINQAGNQDAWNAWLKDNLYTADEYRAATRSQLITLRVRDAVLAQSITPVAGDNAVQQVHARHILVSTEAEATELLNRLNAGESFEVLAAQYSRDVTTKDRGGDLGFFIPENLTTPELAEVAFELQPGEIAGPIATSLGYHIIQTLEFGSVAENPADQALQQEAQFTAWLDGKLASAQIERFVQ